MTTPEDFERLVDPADRKQLYPYDDGRPWYLVKRPSLTLGEVAHASLIGDAVKFEVVGFKRRHRNLQIHP